MRGQIRGLSIVGLLLCAVVIIRGIQVPTSIDPTYSQQADVAVSLLAAILGPFGFVFLLAYFLAPVAGITSSEYAGRIRHQPGMAVAFMLLALLGYVTPLIGFFLALISGGRPNQPLLVVALSLVFMPVAVYGITFLYTLIPYKRREP